MPRARGTENYDLVRMKSDSKLPTYARCNSRRSLSPLSNTYVDMVSQTRPIRKARFQRMSNGMTREISLR